MSLELVKAHYDRFLDVDDVGAEEVGRVESVRILCYESDSLGFDTFVTLGLSQSGITAIQPQELVCSVLPDQGGAADYLVRTCAELVLEARSGLADSDVIPGDAPLLVETRIHGVLTASHPYLPDEFNVVFRPDESIAADLITLIPITDAEIRLSQEAGTDALIDRLEAEEPALLDVTRRSAV